MNPQKRASIPQSQVSHCFVWGLKAIFLISSLGVIAALLMPATSFSGKSGLTPWDKADHFIAFYGLALIAIAAFPRLKLRYLTLIMAAVGFAIEGVQPLTGRDASLADGLANTFGILAVTAPVAISRWRRLMKSFP